MVLADHPLRARLLVLTGTLLCSCAEPAPRPVAPSVAHASGEDAAASVPLDTPAMVPATPQPVESAGETAAAAEPAADSPQDAGTVAPSHRRFKNTSYTDTLEGRIRNRISIKFAEGSGVRVRRGKLRVVHPGGSNAVAQAHVARVGQILTRARKHLILRVHTLAESYYDELEAAAESEQGADEPNLNLWFHIYVDARSDAEMLSIVRDLNALDTVDIAYPSMMATIGPPHAQPPAEPIVLPWPSAEAIEESERGTN